MWYGHTSDHEHHHHHRGARYFQLLLWQDRPCCFPYIHSTLLGIMSLSSVQGQLCFVFLFKLSSFLVPDKGREHRMVRGRGRRGFRSVPPRSCASTLKFHISSSLAMRGGICPETGRCSSQHRHAGRARSRAYALKENKKRPLSAGRCGKRVTRSRCRSAGRRWPQVGFMCMCVCVCV